MTVSIRAMTESDLDAVDRINRLAFGTFFGLPDPQKFRGDGDGIRTRFRAGTSSGVVAEEDGRVVGAAMGSVWGSLAVIGPVMVEVARWGGGVGHALAPAIVGHIAARGAKLIGLFTHPQSASHVRLYEGVGFRLGTVQTMMAKPVQASGDAGELYSSAPGEATIAACREITDAAYPGLDVSNEIEAVWKLGLGDTLLLRRGGSIAGFAVCQTGKGSECGSGTVLAKLAFVRPGGDAAADMQALLQRVEAFGASLGAGRFVAGVNAATGAYGVLKDCGFRSFMNGIAMMRPGEPGYHRAQVFALDDWR